MYFDNARTVAGEVDWFFSPPGAEFFPFPIIYTSETWDPVHWFCEGAGEDYATGSSYLPGTMPFPFKGKSFCGPEDWWRNGCPSNAPPVTRLLNGLPTCCLGNVHGAYSIAHSPSWDELRPV